MSYSVYILRKAVREALDASKELELHKLRKPKISAYSSIINEGYTMYIEAWQNWRTWNCIYNEREDRAWKILDELCKLVDVDEMKAVAIEKSIYRNMTRRHKLGSVIHLDYEQEKSYRDAVKSQWF